MIIPNTPLLPLRDVVLSDGTAATINASEVYYIKVDGATVTGFKWGPTQHEKFTASDTPTAFVAGLPFFSVTLASSQNNYSAGTQIYYNAMCTPQFSTSGSGTRISTTIGLSGSANDSFTVTESLATVQGLYEAARAVSDAPGSSYANITAATLPSAAQEMTSNYVNLSITTAGDGVFYGNEVFNQSAVANPLIATNTDAALGISVTSTGPTFASIANGPSLGTTFDIPPRQTYQFLYNKTDGNVYVSKVSNDGETALIAATAGGNQGNSITIQAKVTYIGTIATDGDSATLYYNTESTGELGNRTYIVANTHATKYATIFPPSGGSIDGLANNAGIKLPAGCVIEFVTNTGLAFKTSVLKQGAQIAVAKAGGTLAAGTVITGPVNCTTCATTGDSFTISTLTPLSFPFVNGGAASANVFPRLSGTINGGSASAAFAVEAGAAFWFYSNDGINYFTKSMTAQPIGQTTAYLTATNVAATYIVGGGLQAIVPATGSINPVNFVHIPPVTGGNTIKGRLVATALTNATAPGGTVTFGLYPVSANAGGADVVTYTLGTLVAGTNSIVVPNTASTATSGATPYVTLAAGVYAIAVVTSATIAASAHVTLNARVEILS